MADRRDNKINHFKLPLYYFFSNVIYGVQKKWSFFMIRLIGDIRKCIYCINIKKRQFENGLNTQMMV